jgi:cation transport protein ChaC
MVQSVLAARPSAADVWVFAYGSLIWNPACEFVEQRTGVAHGWHRSFCLQLKRFRGTPEQPGLMMALDRGGQCKGVAYRLPSSSIKSSLGLLFRREMTVRPSANAARWISVRTETGPLTAIAFVIDRQSDRYISGLSPEEVADTLALAAGHWGSGAEYLHNTVKHLEELGLQDSHLWHLQELVAERIERKISN